MELELYVRLVTAASILAVALASFRLAHLAGDRWYSLAGALGVASALAYVALAFTLAPAWLDTLRYLSVGFHGALAAALWRSANRVLALAESLDEVAPVADLEEAG